MNFRIFLQIIFKKINIITTEMKCNKRVPILIFVSGSPRFNFSLIGTDSNVKMYRFFHFLHNENNRIIQSIIS